MKLTTVKNIGGSILGLVMLLGIGMASSNTAQAQYPYPNQDQSRRDQDRNRRDQRDQNDQRSRGRRGRNGDGYGNYGGSYELRQTALNAGYNEGAKAGRDDRSHNRRFDPQRASAFRNANKDYNSRMGDRSAYQQYFRQAFENGYADAYRGY
jgi:hypothetical protein